MTGTKAAVSVDTLSDFDAVALGEMALNGLAERHLRSRTVTAAKIG